MYDRIAIAERVSEVRRSKKIKQSAICKALSINQSSYSDLETGKRDMTVAELYILADVLSVTVTWLLGENIISNITDEERQLIENFIRYIKKIRNKLT